MRTVESHISLRRFGLLDEGICYLVSTNVRPSDVTSRKILHVWPICGVDAGNKIK